MHQPTHQQSHHVHPAMSADPAAMAAVNVNGMAALQQQQHHAVQQHAVHAAQQQQQQQQQANGQPGQHGIGAKMDIVTGNPGQPQQQGQPHLQHQQAQAAAAQQAAAGLQIPSATMGRSCERCRKTNRQCEPREGALACVGCNVSRVACSLVGEIQGTAGTRRASPTKRSTNNAPVAAPAGAPTVASGSTPNGVPASASPAVPIPGPNPASNGSRKRGRSSTAPEGNWENGGDHSADVASSSLSQQSQMNHAAHQLTHSPAIHSSNPYLDHSNMQAQQANYHSQPFPKRRRTEEGGTYSAGPLHADPSELDLEIDEIREVIMDINQMHSEISRKLGRLNKLWTRKYGEKLP